MQKRLVLLLALLMLVWAAVPAAAAAVEAPQAPEAQQGPISQDEALRRAREAFPPPAGAGAPEISLSSWDGRSSYFIFWRKGRASLQNVSVAAETGEILSYYGAGMDRRSLETQPQSVAEATARATAEALLRKLQPERSATLKLWQRAEPEILPTVAGGYGPEFMGGGPPPQGNYTFTWVRLRDGVPVPSNQARVTVDRQTGAVISYRMLWDEKLSFAAGGSQLSPADARKRIGPAATLELAYIAERDSTGKPVRYHLAWRPALNLALDAAGGALTDAAGRPADPAALLAEVRLPAPDGQPIAKGLTRDQARQLGRTLLALPADVQPRWESGTDRESSFYWEVEQPPRGAITYQLTYRGDLGAFTNIGRAAPKAAVLDPGIGLGDNEQVPNIAADAAREKAMAFAARWYPAFLGKLRLRGGYDVERQGYGPVRLDGYSFLFERVEGGIPVQGDGLRVTIEAKTGQWLGARLNWSQSEFPKGDAAFAKAEAQARWDGAREPVLVYAPALQTAAPYAAQAPGGSARLLWRLLPPEGVEPHMTGAAINAVDGELLDATGHRTTEIDSALRTLAGHWARRELQVMLERGALGTGGADLAPEAMLTRGEALRLFVSGYYWQGGETNRADSPWADLPATHPLFGYAVAALDSGLIDPPAPGAKLAPDEQITRAEFITLAARALNLGPLLSAPLQVVLPASDLESEPAPVQRAAALLAALDVIRGAGGQLRPTDRITRAEGAVIVVRLLLVRPPY